MSNICKWESAAEISPFSTVVSVKFYQTECRGKYYFLWGYLKDNQENTDTHKPFKYCPYCGKEILEV